MTNLLTNIIKHEEETYNLLQQAFQKDVLNDSYIDGLAQDYETNLNQAIMFPVKSLLDLAIKCDFLLKALTRSCENKQQIEEVKEHIRINFNTVLNIHSERKKDDWFA